MNLFKARKESYLLIVLVFILSLLFRVTNLDLIEFKADEGINLFLATRPIFGHGFVPGGTVSSLGITNFPLVNYFLFPIALISLDPMVISFFIALINSLAIVAFFTIVRRFYNQTIAFVASALIATSPWAILFSRKIWPQDFLFPLFIPFFLSIHKIVIDKNEKYWFLYSFSSLLLIQIHHSVFFFMFPLTLAIIFYKVKINYKFLLLGTFTGLIPTIHYVYYQATTGCFDCRMLLTSGQRVADQANFLLFIRPFQILNQGNFFGVLREDIIYFAENFPLAYILKQFYYLEYILLPIGIFLFYKKFKKIRFIIFPIVLLPFIYAFFKLEPHMHYYLIITPFLFLFLGTAFFYFFANNNKLIKYLALGIFTTLIAISVYFNYAFYQTIKNQKNIKGDYGLIFSEKEKETIKNFRNYVNDPFYEEMVIASYVPYSLMHGDIGISRMLFDPKKTERNMEALEQRLKQVPFDRVAQQELIAYYTSSVPSKKTVDALRIKSEKNPGLIPVYEEVKNYYNEKVKK